MNEGYRSFSAPLGTITNARFELAGGASNMNLSALARGTELPHESQSLVEAWFEGSPPEVQVADGDLRFLGLGLPVVAPAYGTGRRIQCDGHIASRDIHDTVIHQRVTGEDGQVTGVVDTYRSKLSGVITGDLLQVNEPLSSVVVVGQQPICPRIGSI